MPSTAVTGGPRPFPILLPGLCLAALCTLAACAAGSGPRVIGGVLDLSGWDREQHPVVSCAGDWKFAWREARVACAAPGWDDGAWETLAVPDSWEARAGTAYGCGWYRLRILNNRHRHLGLYVKNANTAYTLYVNGEPLAAMGRPGPVVDASTPAILPRLVALPDESEYLIALFVSNFDDINGGLTSAPRIGDVTALADMIKTDGILDAFFLGVCFIIVVYFFIVWLLRREDRSTLFFALFCLTNLVRMITFPYSFASLFQPFNVFDLRLRIQYLSLAPGAVFFLMFLATLYPAEFKNRFYRAVNIAAVVLGLFTLVAPAAVFTRYILVYHGLLVLAGLAAAFSLVRAVRKKEKGAALILGGFLILFLTTVNDFIGAQLGSYDLALEQYGTVLFVIIQSVMLAARSAQAFRTSEHLSRNLREEIRRQTSEIDRQNRDLVRLNEERTNFFVNFLHETKTPLTNLRNYLERYLKRHGPSEDARVIRRNMEKLRRDMANLFDLEKMDKGQRVYDHDAPVDCSAFVRDAAGAFRETARLRRVRLTVRAAGGICLRVDPGALDRILNNLLDNAVRYNRPGGTVAVALERRSGGAALSVTNTGPVIPADRLAHVFKPYYQISHAKENRQGIGVGLSLVRRIVDDCGGTIGVESDERTGTTFTVLFPAAEETTAPVRGPRLARPAPGGGELRPSPGEAPAAEAGDEAEEYRDDRHTILVVEDNGDTRAFLRQSLAARFNVFTADNGRRAWLKIRTIPRPHLVISDIMMDEMDGYELHDALMREADYADIPFIFLTARTTRAEKLAGLRRGAIHYIPKPFDIEEVLTAVESLLEFLRRKLEKEKRAIRERLVGELNALDARAAARAPETRIALSRREKQITAFILKGYQNKEIGDCLDISTRTVDKHIENIYRKYKVQSRVGLVRVMNEAGS